MLRALIVLSAIVVSPLAYGGPAGFKFSPDEFGSARTIGGFGGEGALAGPKRFGDVVRYGGDTPQPDYRNGPPKPGFAFYRSYDDVIPKRSFRKGSRKYDGNVTPKPTDRSVAATAHPAVRHSAMAAARNAPNNGNGSDSRRAAATYAAQVMADAVGDGPSRRAAEVIGAEAADAATAKPTVGEAAVQAALAATAGGKGAAERRATAARAAQETSGHLLSRSTAGLIGAEAADQATQFEVSKAFWTVIGKSTPYKRNGPPKPGFAFYRSNGDVIPKRSFRKGSRKYDGNVTPKPSDRSVAATAHPAVRHSAMAAARAAPNNGNGPASRRTAATYAAQVMADAVGDGPSRRAAEAIGAEAADAATAKPTVGDAAVQAALAATAGGKGAAERRATAARAAQETSGHLLRRSTAGLIGAEAADQATKVETSKAFWTIFTKSIAYDQQ